MKSATQRSAPEAEADRLAGLLGDIERLEAGFAAWDESARDAVDAYRHALDALHGAALRRLIRALRAEPRALAALRSAVEDEVVHAVLRYHDLVKPSLNERIEAALASVRPLLASHGGDVDLVAIDPPRIEVRFTGTCDDCAASTLTFHAGVKKAVQDACPEITEVALRGGSAAKSVTLSSPFAVGRGGAWRAAGAVADIPDPGIRALDLGDAQVLLFRRDVIVTCFHDACAHLGAPLSEGTLEAGIITCARHGFRYDLATGACLTAAGVSLQPLAVRVLRGLVEVRIAA